MADSQELDAFSSGLNRGDDQQVTSSPHHTMVVCLNVPTPGILRQLGPKAGRACSAQYIYPY